MTVVSFFPFFVIGVVGGVCLTLSLLFVCGKKAVQTWYYENGDGLTKGPFDTETMQRLYMKQLFSDTLVRMGLDGKWELIENHYQTLCHSAQWLVLVSSQGLDAYEGPFSKEEMRAKFLGGEVSASTMVNPSTQIDGAAAVEAFFPLLSSAFLSDPCHPGQCSKGRVYTRKSDQSDVRPSHQLGAEHFFDMHTVTGHSQASRGSKTARSPSDRWPAAEGMPSPKRWPAAEEDAGSRGSKTARSPSDRWPAAEGMPSPKSWPAAGQEAPQRWPAAEEEDPQLPERWPAGEQSACAEGWPANAQSTCAEPWPAGHRSEGSWLAHSPSLSSSCGDGSEDIAVHNYNPNLQRESTGTELSEDQLERGVSQPTDKTNSAWSRGLEYVETVVKPVLEKGRKYVETGQAKLQERLAAPPPQPLGNADDEEGDPEMSQPVQLNDPGESSPERQKYGERSSKYGAVPPKISNFGPLASHKPQPNAGSAAPPVDMFGWSSFGPVGKK